MTPRPSARPVPLLCGLLALLLLCACPAAALAQSPADEARARRHFEQGETEYRLGRFEAALKQYEAALKLVRRPSIVFNIAQCHRQLGNHKKALFFYRLYLSDWERENAGKVPKYKDEVRAHIDRLSALVREGNPRTDAPRPKQPAQAHLAFSGLEAGARVFVDGVLAARAPLDVPLSLSPGSHRLEVVRAGVRPWTTRITLEPGERKELAVPPGRAERRQRSTGWLVAGIVTAALAVASEAVGLAYTLKANDTFTDQPEFSTYRGAAIGGHVGAGVLAAGSVVSFVMYYLSGGSDDDAGHTALRLAPLRGGALVGAGFRF